MADEPVAAVPAEVRGAALAGLKRTRDMFHATDRVLIGAASTISRLRVACKAIDEYGQVAMPRPLPTATGPAPNFAAAGPLLLTDVPGAPAAPRATAPSASAAGAGVATTAAPTSTAIVAVGSAAAAVQDVADAIARRQQPRGVAEGESMEAFNRAEELAAKAQAQSRAIVARRAPTKVPEPKWHAPWTLMRVISGHLGWVRAIAVDPGNEWFVTGSADRTIKIWDLASGTLKLTLTGHVNTVRALAVSSRHPYLFSAGEDKQVKCWDLEQNKVIRQYHGHLSGVYAMALHPTLDILMTGGRDSVCRVWDMRTKTAIHTLGGHENAVSSILANSVDPQVITGSMDSTIRLWDLAAGKPRTVLTHHKKAVRGMAQHSKQFAFVSGAADNLKKWALPDGVFVHNYSGHNSIVNAVAVSQDDVLVSGGDDGTLKFWDWETGYAFQEMAVKVQPGSLDSEAGIYAMSFDMSGSRLITCEADKSIKVWREDPTASPDTHPIDMARWTDYVRAHKRY